MATNDGSLDDVFARFSLPLTPDTNEGTIPHTLRSENPNHDDVIANDQDTELQYSDIKFGKCLGSGASSKVYEARLSKPYHGHKEVAVKCIFTDLNKEEINILQMFKKDPHPNIIQFLGYMKHEREHLVITELATRGSLYDYLSLSPDETIPMFVVQKWIRDIAVGIKFLHSNNVVHRDLKSPNCLLYQDCQVKICDFGIARETEASITMKTSHLKGSTRWMAPEMLSSQAFSKPSDIYSFGMVVLEVCSRQLPFAELEWLGVLMRGVKIPRIPDGCPDFLKQLMLQCWEVERTERPTIDDIVQLLNKECHEFNGREMELIRQWEEENFPQEHQILPLVSNEARLQEEQYANEERADKTYSERETVAFVDERKTSQAPPSKPVNAAPSVMFERTLFSVYTSYNSEPEDSFELSEDADSQNLTDVVSHIEQEEQLSDMHGNSWDRSWGEPETEEQKTKPLPRRERHSRRSERKEEEANAEMYWKKSEESPANELGTPDVLPGKTEASVEICHKRSEEITLAPGARPKVKGSPVDKEKEAYVGMCGAGPRMSPDAKPIEVPLRGASKKVLSNKKCRLSDYTCDIQVTISNNGLCATPLTEGGFVYLWAGVRATHGVTSGKVCFEMKVTDELDASHHAPGSGHVHVVRVGWSTADSGLHLGRDKLSYGYGGTGQKSCWEVFRSYGKKFGKGDVITSYLDFTGKFPIISYAKNGEDLGLAHTVKDGLQGRALYPHVLMKNCAVEVNLGQQKPSFPTKQGFTYLRNMPESDCVLGPQQPASKKDCEVLMMIGLSGSGKTTWAKKHCKENPHKQYMILGTNQLIDDMRVTDLCREYSERFQRLIEPASECYKKILKMASKKKHNYILDQTNLYPSARRRKIGQFEDFTRKAVVVVPSRKSYVERCQKQIMRNQERHIPDEEVKKMKANFKLPEDQELNDLFKEVLYVELQRNEAANLLNEYRKEVS